MVCVQVSMYEKIVLCVMLAIGGSYGIADGAFRLWLETGGHYQRDRSESRGRAERRWRPAREGAAQSTRRTPSRDRGVPPGAVRDERGAGSSGDPQGFSRSGGEADKHGPPIREDHCAFPVRRRPAAHTGNARISYILGYRSKRLSQVNIIWTSDGTTTGDETVVGIANSLRDYFSSENFKPDSVVTNHSSRRIRSSCFAAVTIRKGWCCCY
jgi:hypothetical protein